ncbi:MAG: oxidoreductase alpha (molybdopterin) subunit [Myxococcaceae bacterium]|nr:oxidoreductase alpha (molybdopterin) subunit [Myxococcaceae bacterium]
MPSEPRQTKPTEAGKVKPSDHYEPQRDSKKQSPESASESSLARMANLDPLGSGETPLERAPIKLRKQPKAAAGIPAIVSTMKYGLRAMGVRRTLRTFLAVNKVDGFDCQSCAWPSPDTHRKAAEFCENGAKAIADELTHERVTPEFFAQHSVEDLLEQSDHWLNGQGRLTHPMQRRPGASHFEPISWADAFALMGGELKSLASPDEAIFYTSGKTCNEAAYLFQLLARQLGTNNLPDCSNMCHESSGTAMTETLGIGKGTVTLEDFDHCDTIFIIGNNPGSNHPRMLTSLEHAKRRGATIVSVNPMPETGLMRVINPNPQDYSNPLQLLPALLGSGTALTDLYVPVRVNGDAAFLQGVMKILVERDRAAPGTVLDRAFIEEHTTNFDDFVAGLERATWEEIIESSGLDRAMFEKTADIVARGKRMIVLWCLGLSQHVNGVENVQQVVNLLLLGGHIGRPGTGTCCVRGHSNVQGDRTMGIWERPREELLVALDREHRIKAPRKSGYDAVETLHAMHERHAKVFFAISGNLLAAAPDTHYATQSFQRCRLVVHVSTKLHRGHLLAGERALILPCLGRAELAVHDGKPQLSTAEDSMGIVNPSRGTETPASPHLLSDTEIIVRTAQAVFGEESPIDWESMLDHDQVRDHISRVIHGFEDFNDRIRKGFFYLPNPARKREWKTATGKARFTVCGIPKHALADDELLMTTVRSHDQFNTVVYGMDDRYRGIYGGRRVILLNADDLAAFGLADGQMVDITSHFEDETRVARRFRAVAYPIARKSAATYFPEGNVLVPVRQVAHKSNQPAHKSVRITIKASDDAVPLLPEGGDGAKRSSMRPRPRQLRS